MDINMKACPMIDVSKLCWKETPHACVFYVKFLFVSIMLVNSKI